MDRWFLGSNGGGVENWAFYDDQDQSLTAIDYQSGDTIQGILDENAIWRQRDQHHYSPADTQGKKVASVPITIWMNWRRDWMSRFRGKFTWQTYELMLLQRPENKFLLTTEAPIPSVYERDKPTERGPVNVNV